MEEIKPKNPTDESNEGPSEIIDPTEYYDGKYAKAYLENTIPFFML